MKKIFFYCLFILAVTSTSCHQDLEIPDPNKPNAQVFWTTAENAVAGVNAIYAQHIKTGTFARWNHFANIIRSDVGYSPSPWTELANWNKFIIIDYNFVLSRDIYLQNFQGIFRANQVLANVPNISMDETLKKRLLGEAQFNRALFYWNLVTLFGNVPVVTQPIGGNEKIPYTTEQQVWAQMEQDLIAAAASLPDQYGPNDLGRATKGAAMALLGKAYLQQKKWQPAADAFKAVVDKEGAVYGLMENFMDNFTHLKENNKESVFEIQFGNQDGSYMNANEPNPELGSQRPRFFAPVGFRDAFAYRWVVNEFHKEKTITGQRDPRLAVSLFYDSTDVRGPDFTNVYGETFTKRFGKNNKEVWFKKFLNYYHESGEDWSSGINLRVIRYADVLLMYAEALNNLNKTAEAIVQVNKVRARATMRPLMTSMTQAAFQKQLEHERFVELIGEDVRWTDLARWGYFEEPTKLALLKQRDPEFNSFEIGKSRLLPIPQIEIDLNNEFQQNPGWGK
jgi:hypothetical protein